MRRLTAPLLALLTVLLLAAPAPAVPRSAHRAEVTYTVRHVELRASNGFTAELEGEGDWVSLRIGNRSQLNEYTVPARISEHGLQARFGKFGRISVQFRRTKTLSVLPAPEGCDGGPERQEEGVFTGSIRFRGEGGFARVDARQARGKLERLPRLQCTLFRNRTGFHRSHSSGVRSLEQLEREADLPHLAGLHASDGHRMLFAFAIRRHGGGVAAILLGGMTEKRKRMTVVRIAGVKASAPAFTFDEAAGAATVTPPGPFTGSASLQRNADGSRTWAGDLSVDILGSEPVTLAGPGFKAGFVPPEE